MLGRKLLSACGDVSHYLISASGNSLVKTDVTTRIPVLKGSASAGATLTGGLAVNKKSKLAYAVVSGKLIKFDVSQDVPVYVSDLAVADIRHVLYSAAKDVLYSISRNTATTTTITVRSHDPITLSVINTVTANGGANGNSGNAYLDEASSLIFLCFYSAGTTNRSRVFAWAIGAGGSISGPAFLTLGGDVGNPPYLGLNPIKDFFAWARNNRYELLSYNSSGLVNTTPIATISTSSSPFSINYFSNDGNHMFAYRPNTLKLAVYDVSTPSSPAHVTDFSFMARTGLTGLPNQILHISELDLLIVTPETGTEVYFVDVANMASPVLLATYTSAAVIPLSGSRGHLA